MTEQIKPPVGCQPRAFWLLDRGKELSRAIHEQLAQGFGSAFEVFWIPDATGFFIRNAEGETMALSKLCQPNLKIIGNMIEGHTNAES